MKGGDLTGSEQESVRGQGAQHPEKAGGATGWTQLTFSGWDTCPPSGTGPVGDWWVVSIPGGLRPTTGKAILNTKSF